MENRALKRRSFFNWASFVNAPTFVEVVSLAIVIIFFYTGAIKLYDRMIFSEQLLEVWKRQDISDFISYALPISEIILGVLLFYHKYRIWGLYGSLIMFSLFTIYIVVIMNINDKLPCSCGGFLAQLSWGQHLVFNTICIALLAAATVMQRKINKSREL